MSTMEAEIVALAVLAKDIKYLKYLLQDVWGRDTPLERGCGLSVKVDNISAIQHAKRDFCSTRTKHMDLRHSYIKSQIDEGVLELEYVKSEDNFADGLTKPLTLDKLRALNLGPHDRKSK